MTFRKCACALAMVGVAMGAGVAQADVSGIPPFLCQTAEDHPNGLVSQFIYQPDAQDYGLRLDNGAQVNTFHFVDVQMCFFAPPGPIDANSVYATLTGKVAHLQSSNGGPAGYAYPSDYQASDQVWNMQANFHLINRTGTWGAMTPVPYAAMLNDLKAAGYNLSNAITMDLFEVDIAPDFDEMVTPAVYGGPRSFDEKPNEVGQVFHIKYRDRLTHPNFAGPQWDRNVGAGWVEPAVDNPTGDMSTRDLLFTLIPEPTTLILLALGLPLLRRGGK